MSLDPIDHQAAALARLAEFLRNKPTTASVLKGLNNRAQEVEDAYQQLLAERDVDSAVGAQLDNLGRIVGQARGGSIDAEYRLFIKARIQINKSSGTTEETLSIYSGLLQGSGVTLRIRDEAPAAFTLEFNPAPGGPGLTSLQATVFVQMLRSIRAAGVRSLEEYGLSAGNATLTFDSTNGTNQAFDAGKFRGTLI